MDESYLSGTLVRLYVDVVVVHEAPRHGDLEVVRLEADGAALAAQVGPTGALEVRWFCGRRHGRERRARGGPRQRHRRARRAQGRRRRARCNRFIHYYVYATHRTHNVSDTTTKQLHFIIISSSFIKPPTSSRRPTSTSTRTSGEDSESGRHAYMEHRTGPARVESSRIDSAADQTVLGHRSTNCPEPDAEQENADADAEKRTADPRPDRGAEF